MKEGKILLTLFSWGLLIFSIILPIFVPEMKSSLNFGFLDAFNVIKSIDFRMTLLVVGFLVFAFALMYLIDFYKKYRGYSTKIGLTDKESKSILISLGLLLRTFKLYALIAGFIILIFRFFEFIL